MYNTIEICIALYNVMTTMSNDDDE